MSVLVIALAFYALGQVSGRIDLQPVQNTLSADLHWLQVARGLFETAQHAVTALLGTISPLYLYGGVAVIGSLYLALFGLGAAAYRTLYAAR
jgi:hypothetical protein